jgi:hypothetical protein
MRTSAQNTKACIGQNAGCMYSSSFHCNARKAKAFHVRQMIVPDFVVTIRAYASEEPIYNKTFKLPDFELLR